METLSPTIATIAIFAHHRAEALGKLEKLAKRASRYGQTISWTERPFSERVKRARWDGERVEVELRKIELTIAGDAPRVGDFRFLAKLERAPGGVLISAVRGIEIGGLGRDWDGRCEHCGQNRARRQAYVVEAADGARKIVGKSCLQDHLGTAAPAGLLSQFTYEDLDRMGGSEEEGGWGGYGRWEESTVGIIAATRAAIALWGWRPSSHEGLTTASYVNLVYGRVERDHKGREIHADERALLRAELKERGDHYQAEADRVLDWGRNLNARGDYEHNLKVALAGDVVIGKTFNLVVSACAAFDRQQEREDAVRREREEREAIEASRPPSHHLGQPGDRLSATVTLERKIGLPDRGFGPATILVFRADDGPLLSWKTSSITRIDGKPIENGERFRIEFTVKAHADFRGTPETRVLRVKASRLAEQAAA